MRGSGAGPESIITVSPCSTALHHVALRLTNPHGSGVTLLLRRSYRSVPLQAVAPKTLPAKARGQRHEDQIHRQLHQVAQATGKPYSHGDTEHKGLLVRVSATGTKTFALAYHSKAVQKTRFLT